MANHIFVTGDTHGWDKFGPYSVDGILPRFNVDNFPEQKEMGREDYVIVAGDFGGVWCWDKRYMSKNYQYLHYAAEHVDLPHGEDKTEKHNLDWLENKPFTTLFVPGNHENYDRLYNAYPIVEYCGGYAVQLRPHVLMLMNGYVFTIAKKKVFTFGGARSHDILDGILDPGDEKYHGDWNRLSFDYKKWRNWGKQFRVKGISWWTQEMPDKAMMKNGITNLMENSCQVDIVVTHCCPTNILDLLGFQGDELTDYLQQIEKLINYNYWIFGHYHSNQTFHIKGIFSEEIMLYEQIIQVC